MRSTPPLLDAAQVLSKRHIFSMWLLALGAGAVNAGAFAACSRFVTHVTGTATQIGLDFGQWFLMFEYLLVLVAFIAGAMASVLAIQARGMRGRRPLYAVPLFAAAALVCVTAAVGTLGLFGPLGGSVEEPADFACLSLLAFAMGLLNAGVASGTALSVRTTHMTGPASDFGVSLATALLSRGAARQAAFGVAVLRGGKVVAFIFGGALMLPLLAALGWAAFALPAAFIAAATLRSFVMAPSPLARPVKGGAAAALRVEQPSRSTT
jgi:uncharacterized membrane protein YoaK (UPF0700 family)